MQIMLHILCFSFLVVLLSSALITPLLLYVLRLGAYGWNWQHCALFSAVLASTDALAISSLLKKAGGPESLVTLMEGESLLNDASGRQPAPCKNSTSECTSCLQTTIYSLAFIFALACCLAGIVLFELFLELVREIAEQGSAAQGSPASVIPTLAADIARLAAGACCSSVQHSRRGSPASNVLLGPPSLIYSDFKAVLSCVSACAGGAVVGLTFGYLTKRLLRWLRWQGASAPQEIAAILAVSVLCFYVANAPLEVSGVIAVVVFGLYGNSTSQFDLGSSQRMRDCTAVQQTLSFVLNSIVFFFAGASSVNFLIR